MKLQWKSVSKEQEKRNSRLRDYRSLIGMYLITSQVLFFSCFKNVFKSTFSLPEWSSICGCWISSEKDVNRTDRNNKFYEGLDNPGLILLHDILMTYCMYDFDLGKWLHVFESSSFCAASLNKKYHLLLRALPCWDLVFTNHLKSLSLCQCNFNCTFNYLDYR